MELKMKIFILFAVFIILAMLISGCTQSSFTPGFFHSARVYDLDITFSQAVANVTIYVPLPVNHGTPMIGANELTTKSLQKVNYSLEITREVPQELVINETIPNQVKNSWFLEIRAAMIAPEDNYGVTISYPGSVPSPYSFIETRYPIGNESVFLPKIDFPLPLPINQTSSQVIWDLTYTPEKIPQKIPIFVNYSAPSSTRVEIFSRIAGSNTWKEYDDQHPMNSYQDDFDWTTTGDAHGWQIADGTFTYTEGSYPNFSSPVWQAAIQPNTTEG
ncbi:MAG TPA: hypothetical protein VEI81_01990 [Methanoregula sp.]|nr:hypothetical protein [Methanoregula sp.]